MSDSPPSSPPPAAPSSALQRYAARLIVAVCIGTMLLPASVFPEFTPLLRHTTIVSSAAAGIANSLCSMVFEYAGMTEQLQYLCLPIGFTTGSVTAAATLA